jgi:hypothetical protein
MMHQIILYDVDVGNAIDMKHQLEAAGLIMNLDFTWYYQQARWDDFSHEPALPKCVKFGFATEAMAVFYKLKWS